MLLLEKILYATKLVKQAIISAICKKIKKWVFSFIVLFGLVFFP
jgi:hypothetical protein